MSHIVINNDDDDDEEDEETIAYSFSKEDCINNLKIILGGRAAEEVIFNRLYTGSFGDVSHAANLCAKLLDAGLFGLEYVDCDYFTSESDTFINKEYHIQKGQILNEAYKDAKEIIIKHKDLIMYLNKYLLEKGSLSSQEIEKLIKEYLKKK